MSPAPLLLPQTPHASLFRPRLRLRRVLGAAFACTCFALSVGAVVVLFVLLQDIFREGWTTVSSKLLQNFPSTLYPENAGLKSGLWGTAWLALLTAAFSIAIGLGAAIYLQEFAPRNHLTDFIHLNIANLAGVPSIVYGILGMAVFVRWLHLRESILSGALTLSLLILPVIIIASREALSAVPQSLRAAAMALGATRWQTVWHHVLPAALPGAMTGIILALSRAIGETAPLIMVGAVGYVTFVPGGTVLPASAADLPGWTQRMLFSGFTALPMQIYDWSGRPQDEFRRLAAAGIIVLLGVLLTLNAVAAGIRAWQQESKIS